jgi:hypothetical protein
MMRSLRGRGRVSAVLFALALVVGVGRSGSAGSLTLTWRDNATDENGYVVERGPSASGPFSQLANLRPSATSYTDTTVVPSTTYCYRVYAFNDAGASAFTNTACMTTGAALVVVDFDAPAPPGASGSALGVFGGIAWDRGWCWWSADAGMDPTNHAGFCKAGATSGKFTFSPAPKTLATITLVSSVSATTTLIDNNGQKIKATVAPGGSVVVTTNWAKASTWVKVTSAAGRSLAVTALGYK